MNAGDRHRRATAEQAAILSRLREMPPGVVVIAPVSGKSALAGHYLPMAGTAIVTALAKRNGYPAAFAGERFCFMAPDALLASGARADWLVG